MKYEKKEVKYTEIEKYSCLEFLKKNSAELYLSYCGKETCPPAHTYGPASRQEFLLHYIIDGKGTFTAADQTWNLKKGDAFLIFPEETTVYSADPHQPWSYIWVAFDGIKALECLEHAGFSTVERIGHFHQETELIRCVDTILSSHQLTYANELIRQSQLLLFLALLIQEYQKSSAKNTSELLPWQTYMESAVSFIKDNYDKEITVHDICSYTGITRSHLTRIFQQALHTSPYDYLLEVRLNKASSLLKTTQLPIKQIAMMVGYRDALVFSKIFKQKTGLSPKTFRSSANTLILSDTKTL